jgi:4-aminobutyrate aminotransferase-like enzyme
VLHNDANDLNVLVDAQGALSLVDFGDVVRAPRVCGLAVACTYAMFGADDPVRAVLPVVEGYHAQWPLSPQELALVEPLVRTRLAMSACLAAVQRAEQPDNDYLDVSQVDVRRTAALLARDSGELALLRLREVCGYVPSPTERAVVAWLESADARPRPVCDLSGARAVALAAGTALAEAWSATEDAAARSRSLRAVLDGAPGTGGYLEDRAVYRTPAFTADGAARTVHLALDVWLPEGTALRTPFAAVVEQVEDRTDRLDYGPVVLLRHETGDGTPFWTLWGHLSRASTAGVGVGARLAAGDVVAEVGPYPENGDWPTHLHLQLFSTLLGRGTDLPGVVAPEDVAVWRSVSPDPALLLRGLPAQPQPRPHAGRELLRTRRHRHLSRTLSLSYAEPLHVVRGQGAYLYDDEGNAWLDLVNNVAHVGHSHPRVVAALSEQAAVLNTNTRYLHEAVEEYADRLLATFPDPLSVLFLTNSGSEANDLALRLARAHTGGREIAVLQHAYHGNLSSLVDISPYKFDRAGGSGRPEHVRVCELPDPYRGRYGADGAAYADDVARQLATATAPAAFVAESLPGCAGQLELAPGYLAAAFAHARAAGAVCVSDEVQVGFGRVGSHLWGFQTQGVVPDVVTLGKPIGNGHPIGAVVATPDVARSFVTGMEYFNTYGGNPVSCRVGLAVLDVLRSERLQAHAYEVGARLVGQLQGLAARHPLVGDVRGRGLYLGVELVRDRTTREQGTEEARLVKEAVKRHGILVSTDGPLDNVLKIKPPMVVSADDLDRFVEALDSALGEVEDASRR